MARIKGAKNFYIAEVTKNDTTYTAGTPEKIPGLISLEIDEKCDSEEVYSDDEIEEEIYGTVVKEGKITLSYLTPELKVKFFGGEIDKDGVYFAPGKKEVKHLASGFEATTSGKGSKYVWYYDTVFSLEKSKYETSEGKPKPQEQEISFKCYKNKQLDTHVIELDMNGATANSVKAAKWFTAVPTSKATTVTTSTP